MKEKNIGYISAGNYSGEKLSPEELEKKRKENMAKLIKGNLPEKKVDLENVKRKRGDEENRDIGSEIAKELEQESFKALYSRFSEDILTVRKMVADYQELKSKASELKTPRFRELKEEELWGEGEKINSKSESIRAAISIAVKATKIAEEQSDLINLKDTLDRVVKNIPKLPEPKIANG